MTESITGSIGPNCYGIIWITKDKVNLSHPIVYDLNYLLDGLLVQTLKEEISNEESNFFFLSENFGHPFFVGHIIDSNNTIKTLHQHLEMMNPQLRENIEIYLLNQSGKYQNLLKDLQKKYPQLTFKNI